MTVLRVVAAGLGLTLQDYGRIGWRRYGIPAAGAMDRLHLAIANRLVGNAPDMAAIESVLAGCRMRVEEGPVHLAASGPGMVLEVDGRRVSFGQSAVAAAGQVIALLPLREGVYGYLAVEGGFAVPEVMGSRSTHRRSGFGIGALAVGSMLPLNKSEGARGSGPNRLPLIPQHGTGPIRIMPGPQDDWFPSEALEWLVGAEWKAGRRSDRMGLFLDGPDLAPRAGSMVTDGVVPGSIQVPPSGAPIVLMRDCQTTGGYPKIATVISADLDRLAQIGPGQALRFKRVSHEEAVEALTALRTTIEAVRPEPASRGPDADTLSKQNLIDGIWGQSSEQ
ncbi:hypothetical protein A8B78_00205 [Jannaschia sp. EhC01]|nr:hypothetical protein A8B78_00205 [Jannaschia sp. EhC01]